MISCNFSNVLGAASIGDAATIRNFTVLIKYKIAFREENIYLSYIILLLIKAVGLSMRII